MRTQVWEVGSAISLASDVDFNPCADGLAFAGFDNATAGFAPMYEWSEVLNQIELAAVEIAESDIEGRIKVTVPRGKGYALFARHVRNSSIIYWVIPVADGSDDEIEVQFSNSTALLVH